MLLVYPPGLEFISAFFGCLFAGAIGESLERVARAWAEDLASGYASDPDSLVTWSEVRDGNGPVVVRRIRFGPPLSR